ncbi:hypothetical protein VMCG_07204 [Cytospora schulzeri]|uniref:Uncharacterized protein n=1 Tax=Cytospora schulzeri TaxID=448051 RepID=A0A423W4X1_9PEZI|nr:hypothetical protein VMCG_07204 [Valsa malicola]
MLIITPKDTSNAQQPTDRPKRTPDLTPGDPLPQEQQNQESSSSHANTGDIAGSLPQRTQQHQYPASRDIPSIIPGGHLSQRAPPPQRPSSRDSADTHQSGKVSRPPSQTSSSRSDANSFVEDPSDPVIIDFSPGSGWMDFNERQAWFGEMVKKLPPHLQNPNDRK